MILVVCPTRGRPDQARRLYGAFRDTAFLKDTRLVFAVDRDDPDFAHYEAIVGGPDRRRFGWDPDRAWLVGLEAEETGDLVRATNTVAMRLAAAHPHSIIANWGDDHIPRTPGWDALVLGELSEPGIAYGDDLIQGEKLPTAPFISAEIVAALGWYALPACRHMYIDDAWKLLGEDLGRLHYLPQLVIEHLHPAVGKAEWDDSYRATNSDEAIARDRDAFNDWHIHSRAADVMRVRRVLRRKVAA